MALCFSYQSALCTSLLTTVFTASLQTVFGHTYALRSIKVQLNGYLYELSCFPSSKIQQFLSILWSLLVTVFKAVLPVASCSSSCLMIHNFCLLCDSKNELFLELINSSYTFYICHPNPEITTLGSPCNNTCVLFPTRTVAQYLLVLFLGYQSY